MYQEINNLLDDLKDWCRVKKDLELVEVLHYRAPATISHFRNRAMDSRAHFALTGRILVYTNYPPDRIKRVGKWQEQ